MRNWCGGTLGDPYHSFNASSILCARLCARLRACVCVCGCVRVSFCVRVRMAVRARVDAYALVSTRVLLRACFSVCQHRPWGRSCVRARARCVTLARAASHGRACVHGDFLRVRVSVHASTGRENVVAAPRTHACKRIREMHA